MARNRNGILLATLAAGAYAYFSKKENRDKAKVALNNLKVKVDSFIQTQKYNHSDETKIGHPDPYDFQDNKMVSEGSQTSIHYYNQEVEDNANNSKELDGLYKKQQTSEQESSI